MNLLAAKSFSLRPVRSLPTMIATLLVTLALAPSALQAKGPAGKIYVASLEGGSQIANGDNVEALTQKSIHVAQGTRIETKPDGTLSMVFSNATGIFLDHDTQIEVKRFTQESFVASRTDLEIEPSISNTEVFLAQGILAVSTSKLAAGSAMTYLTPLGFIKLRGGNLVIAAQPGQVKMSLLIGEGTVHGGDFDLGGHVLHAGEQAVILPGPAGQPNIVKIGRIPVDELPTLQDQAAMAYAARKTVLFNTDDTGEIIAVPVVSANVPVQATVSPSRLPN